MEEVGRGTRAGGSMMIGKQGAGSTECGGRGGTPHDKACLCFVSDESSSREQIVFCLLSLKK